MPHPHNSARPKNNVFPAIFGSGVKTQPNRNTNHTIFRRSNIRDIYGYNLRAHPFSMESQIGSNSLLKHVFYPKVDSHFWVTSYSEKIAYHIGPITQPYGGNKL